MFDVQRRRSAAVVLALLAVVALAACSSPSGDGVDDAENDAAATRFVSCLTGEGQTAKIADGGQVGLLMSDAPDEGEMGEMGTGAIDEGEGGERVLTTTLADEEGTWLVSTSASGYPEEGGQRAAWEMCEEEIPEFEQPEPDISAAEGAQAQVLSPEQLIESALTFATCARENGFTRFADPNTKGLLELPAGIAEAEARMLLDACADDSGGDIPPLFTPESIDSVDFDWFALIGEYFEGVLPAAPVAPTGGDE